MKSLDFGDVVMEINKVWVASFCAKMSFVSLQRLIILQN